MKTIRHKMFYDLSFFYFQNLPPKSVISPPFTEKKVSLVIYVLLICEITWLFICWDECFLKTVIKIYHNQYREEELKNYQQQFLMKTLTYWEYIDKLRCGRKGLKIKSVIIISSAFGFSLGSYFI